MSGLSIEVAPPISIENVLGMNLVEDMNYRRLRRSKTNFLQLGNELVRPYKVNEIKDKKTIVLVFPPLDGRTINRLFYFSAPYKGYGLDTADLLRDWPKVFANSELLERHKGLPGWEVFEREWEMIHKSIRINGGDHGNKKVVSSPRDLITPVVRWANLDGQRRWCMPEYPEKYLETIFEGLDPEVFEERRYSDALGLAFLAGYSPDVTTGWRLRHRFRDFTTNSGDSFKQMEMSPTQSILLSLVFSKALVSSGLAQAFERHIEESLSR